MKTKEQVGRMASEAILSFSKNSNIPDRGAEQFLERCGALIFKKDGKKVEGMESNWLRQEHPSSQKRKKR